MSSLTFLLYESVTMPFLIVSYLLYPLLSYSIHSKASLNNPLVEQFLEQHHGCSVHLGKNCTHVLIRIPMFAVLCSFQSNICSLTPAFFSCLKSEISSYFSILKLPNQNLSKSERPWTPSAGITPNFCSLKKKSDRII